MWVSPHVLYACYLFFWANGASPQQEQKPQLQLLGRSSWLWSAIRRCRRKPEKNWTKCSMEGFPNTAISCHFHISRRLSKKFIGAVEFGSNILCLRLTPDILLFLPDGNLYYHWVSLLVVNKSIALNALISLTRSAFVD